MMVGGGLGGGMGGGGGGRAVVVAASVVQGSVPSVWRGSRCARQRQRWQPAAG